MRSSETGATLATPSRAPSRDVLAIPINEFVVTWLTTLMTNSQSRCSRYR